MTTRCNIISGPEKLDFMLALFTENDFDRRGVRFEVYPYAPVSEDCSTPNVFLTINKVERVWDYKKTSRGNHEEQEREVWNFEGLADTGGAG